MQELLIATSNPGKYREIMEVLEDLPMKFVFLGDLSVDDSELFEDGETFQENAFKKASYYHSKTGILTLSEDSGILVDALVGELGIKTRRWGAGEKASDEEWIDFFLKRMQNEAVKSAKFVCCGCLFGGDEPLYFNGETCGVLTDSLMAPILPGIPISSCFIPDGRDKVYAQLSVDEKNQISHRGKATAQLKDYLKTTFCS